MTGIANRKDLILFLSFLLIWGAVAFYWLRDLKELAYNPDEGAYLYSARFIREGKVPFQDFMHHQPPLYIYFLSFVSPDTSPTLFIPRLSSFFLHALGSLLLFLLFRNDLLFATFIAVLFFSFPIAHYHLLVLPYALMDLFLMVGLVFYLRGGTHALILTALLLALGFFTKPIFLPYILALFLVEILRAIRFWSFRRILILGVSLAVSFLLLFGIFSLLTRGGFAQAIHAQFEARVASQSAFSQWNEFALKKLDPRGFTPFTFALYEHRDLWFSPSRSPLFPLGVLLLGGGILLSFLPFSGSPRPPFFKNLRILLLFGFLFSLLFNLFGLWGGPSWDHYQILYTLPYSYFGSIFLYRTVHWLSRKEGYQVFFAFLLIGGIALFFSQRHITAERRYGFDLYRYLELLPAPEEGILSLDPVVSYLKGVPHACGIHDPFNQYEPLAAVAVRSPVLRKFVSSPGSILRCLEDHPGIPVVVTLYTPFFLDPLLKEWMRAHPQRVVCLLSPLDPRPCLP
jgi:hypothetical protein